ncbi:MAG: nuclear transport factor 2 family protein, partial [Burkholderiaceae bacterium]
MTAELNVQDYIAVQQLYADYGLTLDRGDFDHWPDFFTDDCRYLVQPRDNHDRGL